MASTYLTRTTGTPTLGTKCTVSAWVKISEVPSGSGSDRWIFGEYGNNSNHSYLYLRNSSEIGWYEADGSGIEASIITNRLCRDLNSWYHFMIVYDTTLSTQADRFKMYINGERQTSFSTNTNSLAQNYLPRINKASRTYYIGGTPSYQDKFDGIISHYHHVDGSALDPTVFGSTDSTTGEWKINTSPSFTLGNNGFTILKDGNTITDQSSNSNDFSLGGGTLTKTEDCPSNVFATLNPLNASLNTGRSFANGNNYVVLGGTARVPEVSTLGMTSGKFYAEMKDISGSGGKSIMGITSKMYRGNAVDWLGSQSEDYSYYSDLGRKTNSANEIVYGDSWTDGDIIGVAVDLDNLKIYFSKNGVWQNSGDPTSGATGTGSAFTITAPSSTTDGAYFFACSDDNPYAERRMAWNFGNGYFQTVAVSSAGTNASGNGIFEYDVPTGFTALSTKGLNN